MDIESKLLKKNCRELIELDGKEKKLNNPCFMNNGKTEKSNLQNATSQVNKMMVFALLSTIFHSLNKNAKTPFIVITKIKIINAR